MFDDAYDLQGLPHKLWVIVGVNGYGWLLILDSAILHLLVYFGPQFVALLCVGHRSGMDEWGWFVRGALTP